ncbi:hypothetical protein AAF712_013354 [Marasmius tenuissimus]|uniref:Extracellular membrane protein CFEM domain-containing protein n=1 Tax=Marasmius tenuissimus TaxID=585030 RepID=A0ABR2ZF43_9AGAR
MRFALFAVALLTSSAAASALVGRQENSEHSDSTTVAGESASTTPSGTASAPSGGSTPLPTCSNECYNAQTVTNSCHASGVDTLKCLCTPDSINALGDCLLCTRNIGTDEALTEARYMEENIGSIISLCGYSSISVPPPSRVSITASAPVITNVASATVTIPEVAKASAASARAKASGSGSGSASKSATGAGASASAQARNSGSKIELSFVGALVGAFALVL